MASASSLLSEEQFQCSICLDVFTEPVSTPCGHNFCKTCITDYWDSSDQCHCPMCKKLYERRPDLFVNTLISEMAAQIRKSADVMKAASSDCCDQDTAKPVEVPCDLCTGTKLKALKSCLVCLASYCETHLEPHQRVAAWKRHKLIDPVENLEDRMCKKHDKFLDLFCRSDQTCVCVMCTDHKTHNTVPLEEEYEERKAELGKKMTQVQQMIQERQQNVQDIKHSVELKKKEAEKEMSDCVEVFTALSASIQRSQAELMEVMEEQQRAAEKQAEGFIKELEQEVTELQRRSTELEKLLRTEDHLHLLHSFPSLSTPPPTKDWSQISIHSDMSVGTVRRAVVELEKTLSTEMEKLLDAELKRIQQNYAVDVTLDLGTAYRSLILSADGKQVRYTDTDQNLPDNPERFDVEDFVLGKESFSSGRFYYEVQVKGDEWDLGVVRKSINRKGYVFIGPEAGYWTICLRNGNEYMAQTSPGVPLSLSNQPEKFGVFVDYEEGQVSFYDVENRSLIYSFTGCSFTEELCPFFSPCLDTDENYGPLIITPVKHTP